MNNTRYKLCRKIQYDHNGGPHIRFSEIFCQLHLRRGHLIIRIFKTQLLETIAPNCFGPCPIRCPVKINDSRHTINTTVVRVSLHPANCGKFQFPTKILAPLSDTVESTDCFPNPIQSLLRENLGQLVGPTGTHVLLKLVCINQNFYC